MRVLYVTHYSLMEPLGQSQILPYLLSLASRGHVIEIISFEKPGLLKDHDRFCRQSDALRDQGIAWFPRRYRRGASLSNLGLDIGRASRFITQHCRTDHISLLHCRGHVPFLMARCASLIRGIPVLFDFRGFLAEEYVDAGLWSAGGLKYKLTKLLEKKMAKRAAAMVVLTKPVRTYLENVYEIPAAKLFVIPCCVDLQRFHPKERTECRPAGRPLSVVYSGSTDGRYDLPAMLRFFSLLLDKRPESQFTILSTGDLARVRIAVENAGLPSRAVVVRCLPHSEVPEVLSEQDLGLFFLRGDLTLLAASPTKIGEYLASGLTVIAEKGIGGLDEIVVREEVGCLAESQNPALWEKVLDDALRLCDRPDSRERSMATAAKYYSLEMGVETYAQAYEYAVRCGLHGLGRSRAL